MTSSSITSNTSALSLRNTSERVFTSTSTTRTHAVRTDTVVRPTSTSTTKQANNHVSHNESTMDSVTRLGITSTTEIATPPRNSEVSNSASNMPSSTVTTDERHHDNINMRTSPASTASTSDTDSSISQSVLTKTSTSSPNTGGITIRLGHVPTTAADESNTQQNSETTKNSVAETTNASNEGSAGKAHGDWHTSQTSNRMSSALTEETAAAGTTKTATHNTSTTNSSTTSTSVASVTKEAIRTNDAVTTASNAPSSTDGASTITEKRHTSSNKSANTHEQDSKYGTREGATTTNHRTSTEKSARTISIVSGITESENNASASPTTEIASAETVKTIHTSHTDATSSTSISTSSMSETSNSSRIVADGNSQSASFTDNTAIGIDDISTTVTDKSNGRGNNYGNRHTSTTRSFRTSTEESTKRTSIYYHTMENTNIASNLTTAETFTAETANVTHEPITAITSTNLTTASYNSITKNNRSMSMNTSAASTTDNESIATVTDHSSATMTATRNADADRLNSATTDSSVTGSVTISTEESTGMLDGHSTIFENTSTVTTTSTRKAETNKTTTNATIPEISKASATSQMNTGETVFTSTSITDSTHVVTTDTVTKHNSTAATYQANDKVSRNRTSEDTVTRSGVPSGAVSARIPHGNSQVSNGASKRPSSTEKTVAATTESDERHYESGDMRTAPATVTSNSDTASGNNSQSVIIKTSTSIPHNTGITSGLDHPTTTATGEFNTHKSNNEVTESSAAEMTNESHEGSAGVTNGEWHTFETTSKITNYSAEKIPTTRTASHNASTTGASTTSTSAAFVTEQASSTTTTVITTAKTATSTTKGATSTNGLSTATEKIRPPANKSNNSNEHDSYFGSREGTTAKFLSTSTEKGAQVATIASNPPERQKNVSSSATMETVSLDTVQKAHKSHMDTTTSTSVSGSSVFETSNSSRTVVATTSQEARSTDSTAIPIGHIYTNATVKPNRHENNNGSRYISTTRSFSTSVNQSTKQTPLESHISKNTDIVSNLPTVESVTPQTANVTHQPITYITDSTKIRASDAEQTQYNLSVLKSTSAASATDKEKIATGTDYSSTSKTATRNSNIDHVRNATTAGSVTGSFSVYTNDRTVMPHGYSQIYENSSTASRTSTGQVETVQTTTNATGLENTDNTAPSTILRPSVTRLRNTSEGAFISTSTSTTTHVVSTHTVAKDTSTTGTHEATEQESQNGSIQGSVTRSVKTSTTQSARISMGDINNTGKISSYSREITATAPTKPDGEAKESADMRTSPARGSATSDTESSNSRQIVLVRTSTSTSHKASIATRFGHPSATAAADESNTPPKNNGTTMVSVKDISNGANEGSTRKTSDDSQMYDTARNVSTYSTDNTATTPTRTRATHKESTTLTSSTSTSAVSFTQQNSSTTNTVTTASNTHSSTHILTTTTGINQHRGNPQDKSTEHDSNYGNKEGSTPQFTSTSTEGSTKLASLDSRITDSNQNQSSSATIETVIAETVDTTRKAKTDASTPSTSASASSVLETSNSSRTAVVTSSQAETSTDSAAFGTDHVSTKAVDKLTELDNNNGNPQNSTTRSSSASTAESRKWTSVDSHITENTNIASNLTTANTLTPQTANVTHQPITYTTTSTNRTAASDNDMTKNNRSVSISTSAASATDDESIAMRTHHSYTTATKNANVEHMNNATTASSATGSFTISAEESTRGPRRDPDTSENSSTVTITSTGKKETAETTTNGTGLENTRMTSSATISKTSVASLRNTSESVFTSASTAASTHDASMDTAIRHSSTTATDQSNDQDSHHGTVEGTVTRSFKTSTNETGRIPPGNSEVSNSASDIASSSIENTVSATTKAVGIDQENSSTKTTLANATATSETATVKSSQSVLMKLSSPSPHNASIDPGHGDPSTKLAVDSNAHQNITSSTAGSVRETTYSANKETTAIPPGYPHISDITSTVSTYWTDKTVTTTTTRTHSKHTESMDVTSSISKSAVSVAQQTSNTTNALATTSKAQSSTHVLTTATGISKHSGNPQDKSNEHDSNYGIREGSTPQFTSTSTEGSTKLASVDSRITDSNQNQSRSATIETVTVGTLDTTLKAKTDATTPSTSASGSSVSETSNSSRTAVVTSSQAETSTDSASVGADHVSTKAVDKLTELDNNNGYAQISTTRSSSASTAESRKWTSVDSHIPENTNIASNLTTANTLTPQTANVTHQPITYTTSTNRTTASDNDLTKNNTNVLISTPAEFPTREESMVTRSDPSSSKGSQSANNGNINNATTVVPATQSANMSTESTSIKPGDSHIYKNSKTTSSTSRGKAETAETATQTNLLETTVLENTGMTSSSITTRTSITSLRNKSESVFASTFTATSQREVSTDTVTKHTSTTTGKQSNNQDSQNVTTDGSITRSIKARTTKSTTIPPGDSPVFNNTRKISNSSTAITITAPTKPDETVQENSDVKTSPSDAASVNSSQTVLIRISTSTQNETSTATELGYPSTAAGDKPNTHEGMNLTTKSSVTRTTKAPNEESTEIPQGVSQTSKKANPDETTPSVSVSPLSISEISDTSRSVTTASSHAATSEANVATGVHRISTTTEKSNRSDNNSNDRRSSTTRSFSTSSEGTTGVHRISTTTEKSNRSDNNSDDRKSSTTRSFSTSSEGTSKRTSIDSHITEGTSIVTNLPTAVTVTQQTANVTHEYITSTVLTTASDTELMNNNSSVLVTTSATSPNDEDSLASGYEHTTTTEKHNVNINHNNNAATSSSATRFVTNSTEGSIRMTRGESHIYENSSTVSSTSTGKAEVAETETSGTGLEGTDITSSNIISRTSVTTLRNTSQSLFTGTSTTTRTHVASTDGLTKRTSAVTTDHSNIEASRNVTIEGFDTNYIKTSTTGNSRITPDNAGEVSSSLIGKTVTTPTKSHQSGQENSSMKPSPAGVTSTSDTSSPNSRRTPLIKSSTSTSHEASILNGLGYTSTAASDHSNTHENINGSTKGSETRTTKPSNEESTETVPGVSHISEITSKVLNNSTEKTAIQTTTAKGAHNENTSMPSATNTSTAYVTKHVSSTTKALTTTTKVPTSTDEFRNATGIHHLSTNTSDKQNEQDSNYGSREGSTAVFLSTSTEQITRMTSIDSRIPVSETNISTLGTIQTASVEGVNTSNKANGEATSPSPFASASSVSTISNTSRSVATASSHAATSEGSLATGVHRVSTTTTKKSNGSDSDSDDRQNSTTWSFSTSTEGSSKMASLDSHVREGTSIVTNLPTAETVTQRTANVTHEDITSSTVSTTASDTELTNNNRSVLATTSAASPNDEGSLASGYDYSTTTAKHNVNINLNNNAATLNSATRFVTKSTPENTRMTRGDSKIYENSSTVSSIATGKAESAETTTNRIVLVGTDNASSTIISRTSVTTLRNTSQSVFTSTSTATSTHVVSTDAITKHISTTATDQSNNEDSQDVKIEGSDTHSTKTTSTESTRIPPNSTSKTLSSSTRKTVATSINADESDQSSLDMRTSTAAAISTSKMASVNGSQTVLIQNFTFTPHQASITTRLGDLSTAAADESNTHKNINGTTRSSITYTTKGSNEQSTKTPHHVSHISETTSEVSSYSTEKTATKTTTNKRVHNASTNTTPAISAAVASVTEQASSTTKDVTTSKTLISTGEFTTTTGTRHSFTNTSGKSNEQESSYSTTEGSTAAVLSTSTEQIERLTSVHSDIPASEKNVSSPTMIQTVTLEKVYKSNSDNTYATSPSTSLSAASVSEISNTSRTVVTASSHAAASEENLATGLHHTSTIATAKSNGSDSNSGDRQGSTSRSFSTSTEGSTKRASIDSLKTEGTNIASNSSTAETITQQTADVTHVNTISHKILTTASDSELTSKNRSVLFSTSAASPNDEDSIATGNDHSSATSTRSANVQHSNNAATSSSPTRYVTISTEESTRMTRGDSQIYEKSSTVFSSSKGKTEMTKTVTNKTVPEQTDTTHSAIISRTYVTPIRNTSERAYTSTSTTTSTLEVSADTVTKHTYTTTIDQSNNQDSHNITTESHGIHSTKTLTTNSTRIPPGGFQISNNTGKISSTSTEKTLTTSTKSYQSSQENSDAGTSTVRGTSTSDTASAHSSHTTLIQTSTQYEAGVSTGLSHTSAAAANESNKHGSMNGNTESFVTRKNKVSNEESTEISPSVSLKSGTTGKVSNYSTEKTATDTTTTKAASNRITNVATASSPSAASVTQQASSTTKLVIATSKEQTSADMSISTTTATRHSSTNTSDKSSEWDINYGTRAGSTVRVLSTSMEQSTRTSFDSRIHESEKNESSPVTMQTVSSETLNTTNKASTRAASPSTSASPVSVSEIPNTSKSVVTASSHEATSSDNIDTRINDISTTATDKSNGSDSNNGDRQSAATRSLSVSTEGSTKPAPLDSHTSQGTSIPSNLPSAETVTQQASNVTHEPLMNITTSTKLTTTADNELTTLNKSVSASTYAASSNSNSIAPGNDHSSTTATRNLNAHHNNNATTSSAATSITISTEGSSKIPRGDSQIYENSSTTASSTSGGKVETAGTNNDTTRTGDTDGTSSTILSSTSVIPLRDTSESVFTSTSTATPTHVMSKDTVTKYAYTTAADQSNNEGSQNITTEGFVNGSNKAYTTESTRIALNNNGKTSSSSTKTTSTNPTITHELDERNSSVTTSSSIVTSTSHTTSANSNYTGLVHSSTSTSHEPIVATGLDHPATEATDESNRHGNVNRARKGSVTRTTKRSNEESTNIPHRVSHISEITSRVSNYSTGKTATRTTTTRSHNAISSTTSATSTTIVSLTKHASNTTKAVTNTSRVRTSTDEFSTATAKGNPFANNSNANEHDSNYGSREGATVKFLSTSTSTEKSSRTTIGSGVVESEKNVSSSVFKETESVETAQTTHKAPTDVTTPSMSISVASNSEMSNTSRTVATASSHPATSTKNTATITDRISTTEIEKYKGSDSTNGDKKSSTTRSFSPSTEESTKRASLDFHTSEVIVSNSPTSRTATQEVVNVTQEYITTSTKLITASDTELMNNNKSMLVSTSATSPNDADSISSGSDHSATTTARNVNVNTDNNANTSSSATTYVTRSTEESTKMASGESQIYQNSSTVSSTGKEETAQTATNDPGPKYTDTTSLTTTSRTLVATLRNTSESVFTSTSTAATSTYVVSKDTVTKQISTTTTDQSNNQGSQNITERGFVTHSTKTSTIESARIPSGHSQISNSRARMSSSSTEQTVIASINAHESGKEKSGMKTSPAILTSPSVTASANSSETVLIQTSTPTPHEARMTTGLSHPSTAAADESNAHQNNSTTTDGSVRQIANSSHEEGTGVPLGHSHASDTTSKVSGYSPDKTATAPTTKETRNVSINSASSTSTSAASVAQHANGTTYVLTTTSNAPTSTEAVLVKNITDDVLRQKVNASAASAEDTTTAFVSTHEAGTPSLGKSGSKNETSTDATRTTSGREKSSVGVLAVTPAQPRSFPGDKDTSQGSINNIQVERPSSPPDGTHNAGRTGDIANTTLATKSSMPETTTKSMDRQPSAITLMSSRTSTTPSSVTQITTGHSSKVTEVTTSIDGVSRTTKTEHTSSDILGITKVQGRNNASVTGSETLSVTNESGGNFSNNYFNPTESSGKVINMSTFKPTATNTSIHVRGSENNNTATISTTFRMTTSSQTEQKSRSTTTVDTVSITEHSITNSATSNTQPCRNSSSGDTTLAVITTKMNNSNVGANISADGITISSLITNPTNAVAMQSTANLNISATFLSTSTPDKAQTDNSLAQSSATDNSRDATSYSTGQDIPSSEPSVVPNDSVTTPSDKSSVERSSTGSFSSVKAGNCSGKSENTAAQRTKASFITNPTSMVTISSLEHNSTSASTLPPVASSSSFASGTYTVNLNTTVGSTSDSFLKNQNISSAGNDSLFLPSTSAAGNGSLQARNFTQTGHNSSVAPCISQKANNNRATSDKSPQTEHLTTPPILNGAATSRRSPQHSSTMVYVTAKTEENSNVATGNFSTEFSSGVTSPTETANTIKGGNSSTERGVTSRVIGSIAPCNSTHTEKHSTVTPISHPAVEKPSNTKEAGARHDLLSAKPSRTSPGERSTTIPSIAPTGFSSTAAPPATVKDYILSAVHNGSTAANSNNAARANSSTNKLTTTLPCRNTTSVSSISSMDSSSSFKANTAEVESNSTVGLNTFSSEDTSSYVNGSTSKSQQGDTNTVAAHNCSTHHKLNVTSVESSPVQYRNGSDASSQVSTTAENSSDTNWSSGKTNYMTKPTTTPGCKNSTSTKSIPLVDNSTSNLATNSEVNTTSTGKPSASYFNIWTTVSGDAQTWNDSNVTHHDARIDETSTDSARTGEKQNVSTSQFATAPPCKNSTSTRSDSSAGNNLNHSKSSVRAGSNSGASSNGYPSTKNFSVASNSAKENKSLTKAVTSSTSTPRLLSLGNYSTAASSSVKANSSYVAPRIVFPVKNFNYTHITAGENNSNNTNTVPPTPSSFITTPNAAKTGSNSSDESSTAKNKKEPCQTNSPPASEDSATTPEIFVAVNSSKVAAGATPTNNSRVMPNNSLSLDTESHPANTESPDLSISDVLSTEASAKNSTVKVPSLVQNTTHTLHREPCAKTRSARSRRSLSSQRRSRRSAPSGHPRT
uniref:Putative secreted mucin muc17 n=1 Tax=Rhipicephalus pulchellus TaxID=72859 RepID=L7LU59_RHIPC